MSCECIILFLFGNEIYKKICSFDVYLALIGQKLQNLEFLLIFSDVWIYFQFSSFFLGDPWRKKSEKGSNYLEMMPVLRET